MADTKIEWTDTVWNPVRGCSMVSPGCRNCYAMKFAHRFSGPGQPYEGLTKLGPHGPIWTGEVTLHPERLDDPLRWRKPRRVFVNSMSDLFHRDVPFEFIDKVFEVIRHCPRHTFQILTKRSSLMEMFCRRHAGGYGSLPGNAWIGVSVEDQSRADERVPRVLCAPAAIRWLSLEPLLGPVDLRYVQHDRIVEVDALAGTHGVNRPHAGVSPRIDWAVIGGESGPHARPCHIEWIRDLVQQCRDADVPVFVKQLGSRPYLDGKPLKLFDSKGGDMREWPEDLRVREFSE